MVDRRGEDKTSLQHPSHGTSTMRSSDMSPHRLLEQFKQVCCDIDKVKHPDDVETLYPGLPADFPEWIAMWIMDKCANT
jgi:hypothetical protein